MKKRMKVKPPPGKKVRKPRSDGGQLLSEEGELVPDNVYWQRRLSAGDVVLVSEKVESAKVEAVKVEAPAVEEAQPKKAAKAHKE